MFLFALQFIMPGPKQACDGLNLFILLHGICRNFSSNFTGSIAGRDLREGTGSVFIDPLTKFFKHFDSGANMGNTWWLHDGD